MSEDNEHFVGMYWITSEDVREWEIYELLNNRSRAAYFMEQDEAYFHKRSVGIRRKLAHIYKGRA